MKNQLTLTQNVKVEQHSLLKSILLHLLPGAFITALYILIAPLFYRFGIPPLFAFFVAAVVFLIPFELGYLLYQAKKRNKSFSMEGIVLLRKSIPIWQYIVLAFILLVWAGFVAAVVFLPIERVIIEKFFSWVPDLYFIESFFTQINQYSKSILIGMALLGIAINGFIGPIVEELYFRGFLLPRISRFGRWAPLLNTVLFSLYHFFTPWQYPLRIIALTPLYYAVWWKKNIYLGMIVHCLMNLMGSIVLIVTVLKLL